MSTSSVDPGTDPSIEPDASIEPDVSIEPDPSIEPGGPGAPGSAYAALGGADAVRSLVDDFYRRVTGDGRLARFFHDVDLARLKRHQVLLISEVLGGPVRYEGVGLQAAHARLGITPSDYALVGEHLVTAFRDAGASEAVIDTVTSTLSAVQAQIVTAGAAVPDSRATGAAG